MKKWRNNYGTSSTKCAKTTIRIRKEIQDSEENLQTLSKKYNINIKTARKWKRRNFVEDMPLGPKKTRTVLTPQQEAIIVDFRTKTKMALDDVFIALKGEIPALTRSNLHRCLQRHGVSRLPEEEKEPKKKFKKYPIGYFHIDICEVRLADQKCYLFVAIDRTSKFAFAKVYNKTTGENAVNFLELLVKEVPYKIHTILTDNGIQFSDKAQTEYRTKTHAFDMCCEKYGIEHRLTKIYHP